MLIILLTEKSIEHSLSNESVPEKGVSEKNISEKGSSRETENDSDDKPNSFSCELKRCNCMDMLNNIKYIQINNANCVKIYRMS